MPAIHDTLTFRRWTWQDFERNLARLLMFAGWKGVRLVGGSGDHGADVLAVDGHDHRWIFQCKHTQAGVGREAIDEVREAGRIYGAHTLCVVTSQMPTRGFIEELERLQRGGLAIHHIGPGDLVALYQQAPEYMPSRPQMRPYQQQAVENGRNALLERGRAQIVLATGLGKTVVMSEIVADLLRDGLLEEGRVLVLAHTIPLVMQLLTSFWRVLPKDVATHRLSEGEVPLDFTGITFATVQTLQTMTPRALEALPSFDLVIVDEAHRVGAAGFSRIIEDLSATRLMGVTATPWRPDGGSIDRWFGEPVFQMGIKEGLAQGYLSDVDYRIMLDGIDWDLVREASVLGYSVQQLNKRLLIPTRDQRAIEIIRGTWERENRRRGIVFSPSQTHARHFAADLRANEFRAEALVSEDSTVQRFVTLSRFAAGELDFVCVVDIFNEGLDVPDVDLLVFLRVTHSRRIFVQQLGRGLRIGDGKDKVVVLDFAADVRRIHAAMELDDSAGRGEVESLAISRAAVNFSDRSLDSFFYEWIADLGSIKNHDADDVVKLPIFDPTQFNFPEE
ncbi:DEAD/DEAH box helicase family protein [Deinococcus sp. QL22]|uniref:DEAD/DEAH box helicase family protein n=1 Tax=Deinococcus sp. QL22 TaxID=2939437 RepID=UPI00201822AA|nr:DEAD/DEAH box helicase family protein [Deinococcus sp. QL22]UQN06508.1 DEAD/DEAH box helicase family protein [Deinococcus sp. QL22]